MSSLTFGLGALQGKTMDFVDVSESNARWVQDFRLKAYASPAKLESIDGEGPRPWRVGRVGFQVGLWPHSAPSLYSWSSQGWLPGAVTVYGRPPPASWAQSSQLPLRGEVAACGDGEAGMVHGLWEPWPG